MPGTENYTARLKVLMAQMERKLLSIKGNVGNVSFLNLFLLTSGFEVSMFAMYERKHLEDAAAIFIILLI